MRTTTQTTKDRPDDPPAMTSFRVLRPHPSHAAPRDSLLRVDMITLARRAAAEAQDEPPLEQLPAPTRVGLAIGLSAFLWALAIGCTLMLLNR